MSQLKLNCLVFKNRPAALAGQEVWTAICTSYVPTTGDVTLIDLKKPPINSGPTREEALRQLALDIEYMIKGVAEEGTIELVDLEVG